MKPLHFDMTPLAEALEMPKQPTNTPAPKRETKATPPPVAPIAKNTANQAEKKAKAKPAPKKAAPKKNAVSKPTKAVYPRSIADTTSWLSNLAKEQIHALATHTLARHTEKGLRTLAVTSSLAGEGKTTVSLALADKLAAAGKRVLIIDLDTHRGTLSAQANLAAVSGAMESCAKANGKPITFHSYETDREGVSIMPTGQIDMVDGAPVLNPERIQALVQRALEQNDIVILDCPPLLPVADTHVIGEIADSAILVVRAGATPRDVLEQALKEFGKDKFFAAILNRAKPHHIPYFREVYGYYRR